MNLKVIREDFYKSKLDDFNDPYDNRYKMNPLCAYEHVETTLNGRLILSNPHNDTKAYFWEFELIEITKEDYPEYYL